MSELKTGIQIVQGEYNFLNDSTAGAVGTIRLGVYVPKYSSVIGFWVTELTDLTGGAGATLSFGSVVNPSTSVVNNLMTAQVLANFVIYTPLRGVDLDAAPLRINSDWEVTMSVAVNALTAGRLAFTLIYTESLV